MAEALEAAVGHARAAGCDRVCRLVLRVGVLSGVVPEALEFAFAALREGTPAAAAELVIERVPATVWCAACQREYPEEDRTAGVGTGTDSAAGSGSASGCPICGSRGGELRGGRELELRRVEAE